jgi:hypothetical protein
MSATEPSRRSPWIQVGQRRLDRMRAEVERNRQGGHRVPTWVLALVLVLFVAGWATLVLLS